VSPARREYYPEPLLDRRRFLLQHSSLQNSASARSSALGSNFGWAKKGLPCTDERVYFPVLQQKNLPGLPPPAEYNPSDSKNRCPVDIRRDRLGLRLPAARTPVQIHLRASQPAFRDERDNQRKAGGRKRLH